VIPFSRRVRGCGGRRPSAPIANVGNAPHTHTPTICSHIPTRARTDTRTRASSRRLASHKHAACEVRRSSRATRVQAALRSIHAKLVALKGLNSHQKVTSGHHPYTPSARPSSRVPSAPTAISVFGRRRQRVCSLHCVPAMRDRNRRRATRRPPHPPPLPPPLPMCDVGPRTHIGAGVDALGVLRAAGSGRPRQRRDQRQAWRHRARAAAAVRVQGAPRAPARLPTHPLAHAYPDGAGVAWHGMASTRTAGEGVVAIGRPVVVVVARRVGLQQLQPVALGCNTQHWRCNTAAGHCRGVPQGGARAQAVAQRAHRAQGQHPRDLPRQAGALSSAGFPPSYPTPSWSVGFAHSSCEA
jgi:hypothetical protein